MIVVGLFLVVLATHQVRCGRPSATQEHASHVSAVCRRAGSRKGCNVGLETMSRSHCYGTHLTQTAPKYIGVSTLS